MKSVLTAVYRKPNLSLKTSSSSEKPNVPVITNASNRLIHTALRKDVLRGKEIPILDTGCRILDSGFWIRNQ